MTKRVDKNKEKRAELERKLTELMSERIHVFGKKLEKKLQAKRDLEADIDALHKEVKRLWTEEDRLVKQILGLTPLSAVEIKVLRSADGDFTRDSKTAQRLSKRGLLCSQMFVNKTFYRLTKDGRALLKKLDEEK